MVKLLLLVGAVSLSLLSSCGSKCNDADGGGCSDGGDGGGGSAGATTGGGGSSSGASSGGASSGGIATGGASTAGTASDGASTAGTASGGASSAGAATGGTNSGGKGPMVECPPECVVAITCVKQCGGTPVSVGCCPCVEPAFDARQCE